MAERLNDEQIKDLVEQVGDKAMEYAFYRMGDPSSDEATKSIQGLELVRRTLLVVLGEAETIDIGVLDTENAPNVIPISLRPKER